MATKRTKPAPRGAAARAAGRKKLAAKSKGGSRSRAGARRPAVKAVKKTAKKAARKPVVRKPAPKKAAKKVAPKGSASRKPTAKSKPAKAKAMKKPVARKRPVGAKRPVAAKKPVVKKKPALAKKPVAAKKPAKAPVKAPSAVAKGSSKATPAPAPAALLKAPAPVVAAPPVIDEMAARKTTGIYGGVQVCDDPRPLPTRSPYSKRELERLKQKLGEELDQARQSLTALDNIAFPRGQNGGNSETPGYSTHQAEYASDYQATDTSLGLRAMEEARLAQVNEAADRMEAGLYGVCVACASKIGYQRLLAQPFAVLCIQCRENYEKRRGR